MNQDLIEKIRKMAMGLPDEAIDKSIENWHNYFDKMGIEPEDQPEEFHGIIQARLASGIVSIVAPSLENLS